MLAKPARADGKMYKKGTILVTSTTSAFRGTKNGLAFSAGKMACRAVTQSVTKEYQSKGIHCCSIRLVGRLELWKLSDSLPVQCVPRKSHKGSC